MKKLILTGCAAALFCIGSIAQVQDSASNNLRQGVQETQEEVKDAGNEVKQDAEQTGNEIKQETQEAGNELRQGAEQTGNEIQQGAENAGEQIQQGAERTGEQMEQGAEPAKEQMDPSSQQTPSPNATDMGANAQPPMQEIEVLEDKEGPDNQVIYKYQGEFYYVDREQKQLVKIDEAQLKEAEHKAIISGDEQDKQ
jgi:hypothetical protein